MTEKKYTPQEIIDYLTKNYNDEEMSLISSRGFHVGFEYAIKLIKNL